MDQAVDTPDGPSLPHRGPGFRARRLAQDRDAARPLLWNLHRTTRRVRPIWADGVDAAKLAAWAAALTMSLQIVARRQAHAFEVLPRRRVVERTFARISKHRRTARDYERLPPATKP